MVDMIKSGTTHFIDYREGGVKGVKLLKEAANDLAIKPIILGRDGSFYENDPDLRMNHIHKNIKNKKAKIKVSKRELRKISMSLAKQNKSEMAGFPFLINGKYRLEYTYNKGFYYNVTLNKTSHVYIDTNGKVIYDYFFNGIYT